MRSKLVRRIETLAFVVGVAVLGVVYGVAAREFGWFPSSLLERAWLQGGAAARVTHPPDFVSPRTYKRQGALVREPDAVYPGLTLVTSLWRGTDWNPAVRLIDFEGEVVHQWSFEPEAVFQDTVSRRPLGLDELDFQGSHLFPNGDVLVNVEYAGTVRMDACGEILWRLPVGSHHSIEQTDDGSFWIPGVTRTEREGSSGYPNGFPGVSGPVYQDKLLQVSPDGEVLRTLNVVDLLYDNGLERHIFKSGVSGESELTHVNDVQPLPDSLADEYPLFDAGDLAVSLRKLDLLFVLDPDSRRVRWHGSHHFIHQHDPDFIGNGWIGVFDNNQDGTGRGDVLGGSRIVAIQPHTGEFRTLFPTKKSEPFYTRVRGKWQRLANGNLLLTESQAGRIVEVAPDGRTVWDWVVEPYDDVRVPYVSRGARVDLTRQDVSEWPCSSLTPEDRG